ncbi:hypothetical protein JCM10450v2_001067 [Rhodotorula kratochvilovae]
MSAIGVSTFYTPGEEVPRRLILRLAEVNIASLAVDCFIFERVVREAMSYYRRAWARDGWHWRAIVVFLVVACAVDIGLLAASVGVGLRDIQGGTYSRDAFDSIYIAMKIILWTIGMASEVFFAHRVFTVVQDYKPLVWLMYGVTASPYALAFVFFLLSKWYSFRFGGYARIADLAAGWCHSALVVYSCIILGYRLVLQRRRESRHGADALTDIFRGALMTSALIGLCAGMGSLFGCWLHRPEIYVLSCFWYNLYPFVAAMSTCFALHQRQTLRLRGAASARRRASGVVGRRTGDDPGEWRGDKVELAQRMVEIQEPSRTGKRRPSQRGPEKSFHDVHLDTEAFERCTGVFVRTEVEVEVEADSDPDGDGDGAGREREREGKGKEVRSEIWERRSAEGV